MRHFRTVLVLSVLSAACSSTPADEAQPRQARDALNSGSKTSQPDLNTLAGKVAIVNGTAGLQIRFSAFIEEEADDDPFTPLASDGASSSSLDGTSILAPDVTVNVDTAAAPQNETALAVDPNNPSRVVASANDYVTRTWSCTVNGAPCSGLGDGYSGTFVSNDGGQHWEALATDPSHLGTLIPGVEHLTGGSYDAGGDPALAFDSRGNVYYAGLGFDRTSPPNTVTVNRGTFDAAGHVHWGAPTFINATTSPAIFNDKEWIAVDHNANSRFRDRIYVTWTRFIFTPKGTYEQSPISVAYSSDGGATFSAPAIIAGPALYGQGSRPVVGPDGTVYVFWDGSTRLGAFDSTWVTKSTDGGATWSAPVKVADLLDILPPHDTAFRVNSYPGAAVAPNGDVYVAWSTQVDDASGALCGNFQTETDVGCHAAMVYSRSRDAGSTWSAPALVNPQLDARTRAQIGYGPSVPVTPDTHRVDTFFGDVAAAPNGNVYVSYYAADVVSPWQSCAQFNAQSSMICDVPGPYVNNARLNYWVTNLTTGKSQAVTTQPINTRYQFRGGFIGDYTGLTVGGDGTVHALWTDTNNVQTAHWWYGSNLNPPSGVAVHQEDIAIWNGKF